MKERIKKHQILLVVAFNYFLLAAIFNNNGSLQPKRKKKRCNCTALESQGWVDSQDEHYYEVESIQHQSKRHAELCPLTAGDA